MRNWPPNSPYLNPIENLWAILKNRITARKPWDIHQVKQMLTEEWVNLSYENVLRNLIHSMPDRVEAVIRAKGYPIKYELPSMLYRSIDVACHAPS